MNTRWRQATIGGSVGLLAATALIVAEIPGIPGSHADAYVLAGVVLGACAGWLAWTRVAAYAGLVAAIAVALVTLAPVIDRPVATWIRRDSLPSTPLDAVVVLSSSVNRDGVLDV